MNKKPRLETFENPYPGREYVITINCPEFTSVCPRTGQPDFGEITIEYCPNKRCIELKALKFYMQSYRNRGIFYEALTNEILDDLSRVCRPRWMKVTSRFTPRGGITTSVVTEYKKDIRSTSANDPRLRLVRAGVQGQAGAQGHKKKVTHRTVRDSRLVRHPAYRRVKGG